MGVACGFNRRFITIAVITGYLGLGYGALHPTSQAQSEATTLKIVSSLPMTGNSRGESQTIVNAIQQAIDGRDGQVCDGQIQIEYETYDDATLAAGGWDPDQVLENARTIIADEAVVALVGHYNSGATATSLALYNEANLAVVSPANTYPGLTKPGKGKTDEPEKFFPTGQRNYARVVPADDLQGAVAARWADSLGVETAFLIDDADTYGIGIANVFSNSASIAGIEIVGRASVEATTDFEDLIQTTIQPSDPDLVYFGGLAQNGAGLLAKAMRDLGMTETLFMGPDSMVIQLFIEQGLRGAEGAYGTFGGTPVSQYTGSALEWYEGYRTQFQSEPQPYAIYGYEAASVILDAINQVCANNRDQIRETVLNTEDYNGVLGQWSFDENGDTTLTTFSGFRVENGEWVFVEELR